MNYNPYKIIPAVLVAAIKDNKIVLAKRVNTTYMDGWYAMPGGHLEDGESLAEGAARELEEEIGLVTKPSDLELFHIYQNYQADTGRQYIGFVFRTDKWSGNHETKDGFMEDLEFFSLEALPDKLIPYQREALTHVKAPSIEVTFTDLHGANKN